MSGVEGGIFVLEQAKAGVMKTRYTTLFLKADIRLVEFGWVEAFHGSPDTVSEVRRDDRYQVYAP